MMPPEAYAFLDALAEDESTVAARREGIDPYFILVGGGSFEGLPDRAGYYQFPDWPGRRFSTGISHAAGRYQFQPGTWKETAEKAKLTDFRDPEQQDAGAWFLAQERYRILTRRDLLVDLAADRIEGIATVLQPTWTSLSEATFPQRYREALAGAQDAREAPPAATPLPEPPSARPAPPQGLSDAVPPLGAYQEALNAAGALPQITVNGVWSDETARAAERYYAPLPSLVLLQIKLNNAGAKPRLVVDGVWGPRTAAAVATYYRRDQG